MNGFFEEAIRSAPELYGWEYKKFRKLKPNNSNIY
jgi:lauroyl/myristoyl acyltransferase